MANEAAFGRVREEAAGTTDATATAAASATTTASAALAPFVRQRTVLLTTFRRDGRAVGTPVNIAVDGGRAVVRSWETTGKIKRLRRNPAVEVAPSTLRGRPTGGAVRARARILGGEEAAAAGRLLRRKHPLLHGVLVPIVHRLRGNTTVHMELIPVPAGEPSGREQTG